MCSPWVVQSVVAFTRLLLCVQGVFIALGSFAIAWRMGRGRRSPAASALAIEGLWAAVALVSAALPPGPSRRGYIFGFLIAVTAITGLLVRPVRLYLGLGSAAVTRN